MRIILLPGDGIGPEVTEAARRCLALIAARTGLALDFETHDFGGAAIDRHGVPLPRATLDACLGASAVLLGAVGGPAWDGAAERPESGLLALRRAMGLFANLRPARAVPGLAHLSPLKPEIIAGADILVVRELSGGSYFGEKTLGETEARDGYAYNADEIARVAHVAFAAARGRRGRVTSIDKANVLATSKLWRRVVSEVARGYPDVALDHLYVDAAAMALVMRPRDFDVVLTENMFGDILSDELAVFPGSIGLMGSASLGAGGPGLFEPIHGSAPDIAGTDRANPAGAIASAAMLLRDGLGQGAAAALLECALDAALAEVRTADLGGDARGSALAAAVCDRIAKFDEVPAA